MLLNISLKKFLNKTKVYFLSILVFFLCFLTLFLLNKIFKIKKIELESRKKINLKNYNQLINKNLIFLNQYDIEKQIVIENPTLRKVNIEKNWPSTLKITVDFYAPVASLVTNNGYFDLSEDGRILFKKNSKKTDLPIINYYQKLNSNSYQTGDWISFEDIKKTLYFIEILQRINLLPITIDIKGQDMLVFNLIGNKSVIFSVSKDKEIQDYQLELIVKQFKIEGKDYKKIDLRFEKPIISF